MTKSMNTIKVSTIAALITFILTVAFSSYAATFIPLSDISLSQRTNEGFTTTSGSNSFNNENLTNLNTSVQLKENTTEERLKSLEARVKALEAKNN